MFRDILRPKIEQPEDLKHLAKSLKLPSRTESITKKIVDDKVELHGRHTDWDRVVQQCASLQDSVKVLALVNNNVNDTQQASLIDACGELSQLTICSNEVGKLTANSICNVIQLGYDT